MYGLFVLVIPRGFAHNLGQTFIFWALVAFSKI